MTDSPICGEAARIVAQQTLRPQTPPRVLGLNQLAWLRQRLPAFRALEAEMNPQEKGA